MQAQLELTLREIADAVEQKFEIMEILKSEFDSNSEEAPLIWRCLMKNR